MSKIKDPAFNPVEFDGIRYRLGMNSHGACCVKGVVSTDFEANLGELRYGE